MATDFISIPDWFSWDNQGAGIAVADLTGNGQPDLIVLQVDNPPGANQGFYRVGSNLDANGQITNGWGPWIAVPDWFSHENQGADMAIADLNGNGQPDLIIFQIDSPPGQNQGFYRIGWNLDAAGNVTGGWSPWIAIADWFSWENQGAGVAVADVSGNGQLDLIIFQVDSPEGANKGFYRIGWNLDAAGNVTGGWSPWFEVDWFSWENQDAGIAVADLDGNGRPELIVFQIDNPPGANQGYYQIGWNLDTTGKISGGWSPWVTIADWPYWDNQGAGVAAADLNQDGRAELILLQIDNPPQANQGYYRVLDLEIDLDQATANGIWRLLPENSQILAMHAALFHTNKVCFFSGSSNNPANIGQPFRSVVWDYSNGTFFRPDTPIDLFCCEHAFLSDGRLLAAGGTKEYDFGHPFLGLKDAVVFDPADDQWKRVPNMASGRWYPTLVALGGGRVLAVSGLGEDGLLNLVPEIYSEPGGWTALPSTSTWAAVPPTSTRRLPLYAHLFLLRDGRLFYAGGQYGGNEGLRPCLLDLNAKSITEVGGLEGHDEQDHRNQSASVLLPPVQDQRVMLIGGGAVGGGGHHGTEAIPNVNIIDLKAANPSYVDAAFLHFGRMHLNAVLLPDRTVLVCGGSREDESRVEATLEAELYDPVTNQWTLAAKARVPRLYHSVALLLPDGRVITAGSNPARGDEELRLEMYYPPYLFKGPRPFISSAPQAVQYGNTLEIKTPQAGSIKWASLIKPRATTHSLDTEQRVVDLPFSIQTDNTLKATVTNESNLAPPGWYMLFITDNAGVPSVATWVHLSA